MFYTLFTVKESVKVVEILTKYTLLT
jgi:hypothetical protein